MLRNVISGATALATLLIPTDASAMTVRAAPTTRITFSGTVLQSTPGPGLLVAVRNGRRDASPRSITVTAAGAATIRLDGRPALISRVPSGARITVTGGITATSAVLATDITATR